MSKQKTLGEVITETNIQTYQRMYESLRVATHAGFSNSIIKQMRDEMKAVRMGKSHMNTMTLIRDTYGLI